MKSPTLHLPVAKAELRRTLKKYGVVQAGVFGTHARGKAGSSSDLDLFVILPAKFSLFDLVDLQDELQITTGCRVDVVADGNHLSQRFKQEVARDLIPLEL